MSLCTHTGFFLWGKAWKSIISPIFLGTSDRKLNISKVKDRSQTAWEEKDLGDGVPRLALVAQPPYTFSNMSATQEAWKCKEPFPFLPLSSSGAFWVLGFFLWETRVAERRAQ